MIQKILYACLLVICLFSCQSVRVKDIQMDYTQEMKGTVKSVLIRKWNYYYKGEDTISKYSSSWFDDFQQKHYTHRIDTAFGKRSEYRFFWQNDQLLRIENSDSHNIQETYSYDKKGNPIKIMYYEKGSVYLSVLNEYDKRNNVIKTTKVNAKDTMMTSHLTYSYEYPKQTVYLHETSPKNKQTALLEKRTFDKKGNLTSFGYVTNDALRQPKSTTILEYDHRNNLTRATSDENGKVNMIFTYENSLDSQGNIKQRLKFANGKLVEKSNYFYTYL